MRTPESERLGTAGARNVLGETCTEPKRIIARMRMRHTGTRREHNKSRKTRQTVKPVFKTKSN